MPSGVQIGRLFGTDIYASFWFFFLLAVPFLFQLDGGHGLVGAAVFDLALLVSLLVHEFGHVFAVKWFLKGRSVVVLWGLGGLCLHEPTPDRRKRIGIALMGPAFQFALWGALLPFAPGRLLATATDAFLANMLSMNLVWPLLNLLPILPLDGGQAARAALEYRLAPGRALRLAAQISIAVAVAGIGAAWHWDHTFAIFLAGLLLLENLKTLQSGI